MCYTDSKCFNCSGLERQSNNEVAKESVCTTVMITEHETNSRSVSNNYSINGSLANSYIAPSLAIISTLELANGQNVKDNLVSERLCSIGRDLCRIIATGSREIDYRFISSAFNFTTQELKSRGKTNSFNFSFPLIIPQEINDSDPAKSNLLAQLSLIGSYFSTVYNMHKPLEDGHGDSYSNFCTSDATEFCDNKFNPKINNFVSCCNEIGKYINYPFSKLTTSASEVIKSTTVIPNIINHAVTESIAVESKFVSSTGASDAGDESLSPYLCHLGASLCRLIMINKDGSVNIDDLLKSAFDKSADLLEGKSTFNFGKPLIFNNINSNDGKVEHGTMNQLWSMSYSIHGQFNTLWRTLQNSGINPYKLGGDCLSTSHKFCTSSQGMNFTLVNKCCDSIFSYLGTDISPRSNATSEPVIITTTTPITTTPEVLNSTAVTTSEAVITSEIIKSTTVAPEVVNLSTISLSTLIPTEITSAGTNVTTLAVVLISFLSIAFAIFSFLGYKFCKKAKSPQPVSQSNTVVNVAEEIEDLV
ncbi:OadG family protein [Candidatus Ichthyocystis sparus]|uniref:OadG family protein n=1 Tax=Candidatus Ichthyocystis sparus TaxID=1561004 RepID=UPI000B8941D1|nr:OadG family protein [Candidatus Ichthyocystis sparus]